MITTGIIITLIGLAHNAMSPMIYQQAIKDQMSEEKLKGMVYFFAIAGIAFAFAGSLIVLAHKGIKREETWEKTIAFFSSLFIAFSGIFAMFYAGFFNILILYNDI